MLSAISDTWRPSPTSRMMGQEGSLRSRDRGPTMCVNAYCRWRSCIRVTVVRGRALASRFRALALVLLVAGGARALPCLVARRDRPAAVNRGVLLTTLSAGVCVWRSAGAGGPQGHGTGREVRAKEVVADRVPPPGPNRQAMSRAVSGSRAARGGSRGAVAAARTRVLRDAERRSCSRAAPHANR